jgi:hypothetical protein
MRTRRTAEKTKENIRDASDELAHRLGADTERAKRALVGGAMTTTQKTKSALREVGHRTAAGIDKTKRKLRGMV